MTAEKGAADKNKDTTNRNLTLMHRVYVVLQSGMTGAEPD
jgi:hypothetical protein